MDHKQSQFDGVQVYSLVPVTEVSLDKAEIILVADETETLIAQ